MKIARVLLKALLEQQNFESWSLLRKDYFPTEFHSVFDEITHFVKNHREIPTPDQLRLALRDRPSLLRLEAVLTAPDTDVSCDLLVEYLKDAYVQQQILGKLHNYVKDSVAFETAEESLESLSQIIIDVEAKASLKSKDEDMQYIELFEPPESLERRIQLGLNTIYDNQIQFAPTDYILIGGRRGAGKSLTCSNVTHQVVCAGKSALYFTIEMDTRSILQRAASIATGVPHYRIRNRDLQAGEMQAIAKWWSDRFIGGEEVYENYLTWKARSFDRLHTELSENLELVENRLDIVYDPTLTIARIDAEVKKRQNLGAIVVDYVNQVSHPGVRGGQYDWQPQIEISKHLKALAQEFEIPVIAAYQTDNTGEARFAKGILDSADSAFSLEAYTKEDNCMTFKCQKMRNAEEIDFTSVVDWASLRIGPESSLTPDEREAKAQQETVDDSENDL